jgi:hypothetical protein
MCEAPSFCITNEITPKKVDRVILALVINVRYVNIGTTRSTNPAGEPFCMFRGFKELRRSLVFLERLSAADR